MPSFVCAAKASYKKLPGLLELTEAHLQWAQDGKQPSVRVPLADVSALFCSKEGAQQVRLKVALFNDENGHSFAFTSPKAQHERENFKTELTAIVGRNRASAEAAARAPAPPKPSPIQAPPPPATLPQRPSISHTPSRAASVSSSDPRNLIIIPGNDYATDVRLRKEVLKSDTELGALHRELVAMTGQLSEVEFWEGREHLLLSLAASENQRKGKPGPIVDPRPETVEGEIKIVMTPQMIQEIFEEYPVIAKAHRENVPSKLSEGEFWTRYFKSKLYHAHRASIRSTAVQHVVQDDPILDKYLERIDDELEPRRQRSERVELFVDLAATSEDHVETGNEKDVTMLAGRQRGALPLIRKFNEHSERLLNSALGDIPASKRQKLNADGDYGQIDLDDLHDAESAAGIVLEMQDRQRYFEGGVANGSSTEADKPRDMKSLIRNAKQNMDGWEAKLSQLKIERPAGDAAFSSMTQNVSARLEVKMRKSRSTLLFLGLVPLLIAVGDDIPDAFFRQMTICQAAANEFLRQFWSSMHPPATEVQVVALPTPQQRAAKAAKMISFLSKTQDKVDALVHMSIQYNVDPKRVEIALKPIMTAVNRAIGYHQTKTTKPAARG
ncbi:hypothetical protein MIND_00064200 [Mycena indigotica]|uniref:BSD domain-containing protein n=1 Tax=Mycena indigotica TaxID=2126181 RepID=A0A8H6TGT6_9AGAR|nr:uncharacterized protein MIND_00064200 [Mycena indigotica]KAF7315490.1 hypothetical protein MIND_00064200 [Mycena indigotica]